MGIPSPNLSDVSGPQITGPFALLCKLHEIRSHHTDFSLDAGWGQVLAK